MRVALLAPGASIHTIRWANGLSRAGARVHLITQHTPTEWLEPSVTVSEFPNFGRVGYFTMASQVRRLLMRIQPDILNAHYASGYGTTGRLTCFRPYLLSIWGSDVYDFPTKSILHRYVLRRNLAAPDGLASTSHDMARRVRSVLPSCKPIAITPFGVDTERFRPLEPTGSGVPSRRGLVIGTIKTMGTTYGIDTLLKSFARLRQKANSLPACSSAQLSLRLVGDGPELAALKSLAQQLSIQDAVTFVGHVPHDQVPTELSKLDVYVALSRRESFGVGVIEAGASGLPVVVSDAGGLPEVVANGKTGFVVPVNSPEAASEAIFRLIADRGLREAMGSAGREHVQARYSWTDSVQIMLDVYGKLVASKATCA